MSLPIKKQSPDFYCTSQIAIADIPAIAAQGFKSVVNNRPDDEGGANQPSSAQLKAEAERHGLQYFYIPVVPGGITQEHAVLFQKVMASASKPVLGFCLSGKRASSLYQMAFGND
jgi:uncharacterized protein (TIGR01244 family)